MRYEAFKEWLLEGDQQHLWTFHLGYARLVEDECGWDLDDVWVCDRGEELLAVIAANDSERSNHEVKKKLEALELYFDFCDEGEPEAVYGWADLTKRDFE